MWALLALRRCPRTFETHFTYFMPKTHAVEVLFREGFLMCSGTMLTAIRAPFPRISFLVPLPLPSSATEEKSIPECTRPDGM